MTRVESIVACCLLLCVAVPAHAQYSAEDFGLTDCGQREPLFRAGMEAAEQVGVRPSGGAGDDAPGAFSAQVFVPDAWTNRTYLLQIPAGYDPAAAWPLVVVLHGSQGSVAASPGAASAIRDLWQPLADREGAVVLAPIASGSQGGWVPGPDTSALACAIAQVERRYNIDRSRRHLWGFSAGAHYAHALALGNPLRFASYAINAGALHALACGPAGSADDCAVTLPAVVRRIPVSLRVGTLDATFRTYVQGDLNRFRDAGWTLGDNLTYRSFSGGHTVGAADVDAAWAWFEPRPLPP